MFLRYPHACPRARLGMTAIEMIIASIILLVALMALASSMGTSAVLRAITRENGAATDAAGNMLERLYEAQFDQVYRQFNSDPLDDLAGAGTAPGHRFAVEGLEPLQSAADGLVGEVVFPEIETVWGGVLAPGEDPPPPFQLREDFREAALGMPRDLNGDLVLDKFDHSADYFVLPIKILLRWRGRNGNRELTVYAMLSERPR